MLPTSGLGAQHAPNINFVPGSLGTSYVILQLGTLHAHIKWHNTWYNTSCIYLYLYILYIICARICVQILCHKSNCTSILVLGDVKQLADILCHMFIPPVQHFPKTMTSLNLRWDILDVSRPWGARLRSDLWTCLLPMVSKKCLAPLVWKLQWQRRELLPRRMPHFLVSRLNHPPPFTKSPTQLVSRLHTECTYHRFRSYLSGTPEALVGIYQKSRKAWSKAKHRLHVVSFKVYLRISSRQSNESKSHLNRVPLLVYATSLHN